MAGSTLDPDNVPAKPGRHTQKGHDLASLGPSDTSDSGSDVTGAGREVGDRVVGGNEAGLGGGLDEAEEARRRKTPSRNR